MKQDCLQLRYQIIVNIFTRGYPKLQLRQVNKIQKSIKNWKFPNDFLNYRKKQPERHALSPKIALLISKLGN